MRKIAAPYTDPAYLFRHGGATKRGILDFSVNVNPLGPPQSVLAALRENLPSISDYPDPECRQLIRSIATHHDIDARHIVVGNGSNELIYAVAHAFRPKRVAIAEPTYTEYLRASLAVNAVVDHWLAEGDDFVLNPFDPEGAELVWLCNPNNPTGQLWTRRDRLLSWIRQFPDTLFVVDEAFMSFCASAHIPTLIASACQEPNLIVLRSLTKYYALPGLRLGYAVAGPDIRRRLAAHLAPWSVSQMAQVAGAVALADDYYLAQTREWFPSQIESLHWRLEHHRDTTDDVVHFPRSETNFVLVRVDKKTCGSIVARLASRGIAVRDASNFVGLDDSYIRIAVRLADDTQRLFREWSAS